MRWTLWFFPLFVLTGCMTLEERMARRTGCNAKTVDVRQTSWSPGHTNYLVKCPPEKKSFLCTDTAFSQTCAEKK